MRVLVKVIIRESLNLPANYGTACVSVSERADGFRTVLSDTHVFILVA